MESPQWLSKKFPTDGPLDTQTYPRVNLSILETTLGEFFQTTTVDFPLLVPYICDLKTKVKIATTKNIKQYTNFHFDQLNFKTYNF